MEQLKALEMLKKELHDELYYVALHSIKETSRVQILKEAIEELEALNNRSCESCKFVSKQSIDEIYCDMFQCYQQKALKYCGNWELK